MLTRPLLQGRSRGNDALHADRGVADGQSGCKYGFWIPDSWAGAGKWAGVEDHRGAEGYKYAYHLLKARLESEGFLRSTGIGGYSLGQVTLIPVADKPVNDARELWSKGTKIVLYWLHAEGRLQR